MTRNVDSKLAQLLNQSPNFGTAGPNLGSYFGSTNDYGGMRNKKTHNASQSSIALRREFL
jgi:hypothetical protein